MVDWQITATTIYCDAVDSDVTLMVYKDGSTKCAGYSKYGKPDKEIGRLLQKKGKQLGYNLECEGPECPRMAQYRDRLFAEEAETTGKNKRAASQVRKPGRK